MFTITVPNEPVFEKLIGWLKRLGRERQFGLISTPDGEELVVMHPEQVAELDAVLSDPALLTAVNAGVSDILRGQLRRVDASLTLREAAEGSLPCDAALAAAAEQGVKDLLDGQVSTLQNGQSLRDLL